MKSIAIITGCLLLVLLQAIINTVAAAPAAIQCANGEYAESKQLCNVTGQLQPENCNGDDCINSGSDQPAESGGDNECSILNCSKEELSKGESTVNAVREAFNKAHFVVRGKVSDTFLMGVDHVAVVTMVQLVMKSTHTFLTPGKLELAVPLDPDWMCKCPGVDDFHIGDSYLITGKVQKRKASKSKHILKVYHDSLVVPWNEKILDDMEHNKTQYHRLTFRPTLPVYKKYFS